MNYQIGQYSVISRRYSINLRNSLRTETPLIAVIHSNSDSPTTTTTRNSGLKKGNVMQEYFSSRRFLRRLFLNLWTFRYSLNVPRGPFILQRGPRGPSWIAEHVMGAGRQTQEKERIRMFKLSGRSVRKVRGAGERRRKGRRIDMEVWRKRGRRQLWDGGPRETGGATQNRVAAGSGSASRLSLAIALVRRVKVGINGRRTLLEYGRGDGDGGRGKGPSCSVAGARHGGAIAAAGVSSWVPKEEKLSWRTDAPRTSPFPFLLSLLLVFCRRRNGEFFRRVSEEDGGRLERVRSSLWKVPRLVRIYCFVGENCRSGANIYGMSILIFYV